MIDVKKILVATDFSDHARTALEYAASFASSFGSEVLLCHVVPGPDLLSQLPPGGEGYFPPNFTDSQQQAATEEGNRWLQDAGVSGGRMLTPAGTPFVEIVRLAREEDVDLVVVGTHGRGAVAHMLLGSVAEKVVRKSPCPVLTVPQKGHTFSMP
ncbi:MAG: universal stress protein [Planctomycetaceae bacterium]|jgi:nucleotide-binding universal stress UspA family protein|nr:universal stress protein [Planctomycetaceae bacterium]MBT6486300.1 universal stress protein [Planctomycetaceae bacterium]